MAEAYECDRCGTVETGHPAFKLLATRVAHKKDPNVGYDLCEECKLTFTQWIQGA